MILPLLTEEQSKASDDEMNTILVNFVRSVNHLNIETVAEDSLISYHLQRMKRRGIDAVSEGARTFFSKFNTKKDRLQQLTRLNMMIGEDETEESVLDAPILSNTSTGRVSTSGGIILSCQEMRDALDIAEQKRKEREEQEANKQASGQQRAAVVARLKMYGYIPADHTGKAIMPFVREFMKQNGLRSPDWPKRLDEILPRLKDAFSDPTRTWRPPPPPSAPTTSTAAANTSNQDPQPRSTPARQATVSPTPVPACSAPTPRPVGQPQPPTRLFDAQPPPLAPSGRQKRAQEPQSRAVSLAAQFQLVAEQSAQVSGNSEPVGRRTRQRH